MIKKKTIFSAILYSLLFVLSICGGLIVLPIIGLINPLVHSGQLPNPGLFGLGFGLKAAVFTTIGHIIFGTVLGYFSQYRPLTHIRKHPKAI